MVFIKLSKGKEYQGILACMTDLSEEAVKAQICWLRDQLEQHSEGWDCSHLISLLPYEAEYVKATRLSI